MSNAAKDRVRLWLRLLKVVRGLEQELRDTLRREHNTTLPRFDVMSALSRHPEGLKMSQLSGVLRVSNGNVTGIADRLSEEGLVERIPVPGDRRAMMLRLTPEGAAQFARQAQAHEDWINEKLRGISSEEARAMAARLQAFAAQTEEEEKANA
ncbi:MULTISPECIES: MarR family winged helix-turn-helix transcriptional regulator [Sulfitobacter]|uniref:MarR family winged helix-turn-helix transcriptional regulator n=1 Tax=Sulfitobacter TaxID=60136 RepID=UPI002308100B|nr:MULTISPECIES: MarR family transcriptional regulator [Sulfitobacter]MDF3382867.1 MarR family transcriptional regulator [Sulfitobacter sp. Ks11]MDF3386286.1 MarR family transcriptional regulator [Sulfitobacter sp. M85]MDF3389705.1 MarR family transcriptional regulator [Sulfitobacter sp. Ks16]MDF3400342.1 MarR family transcriptional regulator [Sulfitobacter sp. KE39]MDF3403763.1 MarR family transcriptional regulator [Sulfitobacter sp. Ks35]